MIRLSSLSFCPMIYRFVYSKSYYMICCRNYLYKIERNVHLDFTGFYPKRFQEIMDIMYNFDILVTFLEHCCKFLVIFLQKTCRDKGKLKNDFGNGFRIFSVLVFQLAVCNIYSLFIGSLEHKHNVLKGSFLGSPGVRCASSTISFNILFSQTADPIWTKLGRNVPSEVPFKNVHRI